MNRVLWCGAPVRPSTSRSISRWAVKPIVGPLVGIAVSQPNPTGIRNDRQPLRPASLRPAAYAPQAEAALLLHSRGHDPTPRDTNIWKAGANPSSRIHPHFPWRLSELTLRRPRQWGACWLAQHLWQELHLDRFWSERLPASRKGTRWEQVLFVLTAYRLIAPGSEWQLYRQWFDHTALPDLLGCDTTLATRSTPP